MRTITHTTKPTATSTVEIKLPSLPEKPILFSDAMVRAILAGRKTQTRRIVDPQPTVPDADAIFCSHEDLWFVVDKNNCDIVHPIKSAVQRWRCRYGVTGTTLWVREAWSPDHAAFYPNFPIVHRADSIDPRESCLTDVDHPGQVWSPEQKAWYPFKWRPSIHMPRSACRLTLRVKNIRIERLSAITEEDALAEGIEKVPQSDGPHEFGYRAPIDNAETYRFAKSAFIDLWDSINGEDHKTRWKANPWVWRIEFGKNENKTV